MGFNDLKFRKITIWLSQDPVSSYKNKKLLPDSNNLLLIRNSEHYCSLCTVYKFPYKHFYINIYNLGITCSSFVWGKINFNFLLPSLPPAPPSPQPSTPPPPLLMSHRLIRQLTCQASLFRPHVPRNGPALYTVHRLP